MNFKETNRLLQTKNLFSSFTEQSLLNRENSVNLVLSFKIYKSVLIVGNAALINLVY